MMEGMTDTGTHTATPRDWWDAARPHTWPNAFAPVIAGTGDYGGECVGPGVWAGGVPPVAGRGGVSPSVSHALHHAPSHAGGLG